MTFLPFNIVNIDTKDDMSMVMYQQSSHFFYQLPLPNECISSMESLLDPDLTAHFYNQMLWDTPLKRWGTDSLTCCLSYQKFRRVLPLFTCPVSLQFVVSTSSEYYNNATGWK